MLVHQHEQFLFSQVTALLTFANNFQLKGRQSIPYRPRYSNIPGWSKELRECYDRFPNLKIIFAGSSVMRLKDENPELNGIAKSYNLPGFSFQ
jgi:hypothetical protein